MNKTTVIALCALILGAVVLWYLSTSPESDAVPMETEEATTNEQPPVAVEEEEDSESVVEVGQPMPAGEEGSGTEMVVEEQSAATVAEEEVKEFTIDSFSYGYSLDTITVSEGDMVTINLTSSGGLHDWVVDEFNAATDIIGVGDTTSVTFVADQAGTYEFYCSVGSHRAQGMVGTLVVE